MARKKKPERKIAVIDFETDPFLHGRVPKAFAAGFYDGETYKEFWGDDCADNLIRFLNGLESEYFIYAHNGGKFDFYYLFDYLENPLKIIGGRIVQAGLGKHILRDSFAILPIPLAAYEKDEIDYACFEADKREENKEDILHYLAKDCEYLYKLVRAFVDRFGPRLTIGGTAIKQLMEIHPVAKQSQGHDERFRPFYYGGRCQAFETGIIKGRFKVFDVNSMYPGVMKNYQHPVGRFYASSSRGLSKTGDAIGFGKRPYFARIIANNRGALPMRCKNEAGIESLNFEIPNGEFFATSHEIRVALKYKLIDILEVKELLIPAQTINFADFVDKFYAERQEAKKQGDKANDIFSKLILNSAYGRMAINPINFFDWHIAYFGGEIPEGFQPYENRGDLWIYRKPATITPQSFHDVAVAASITGAARATLLEALALAKRPLYCDTDSIICEKFAGDIDPSRLGAWKEEAELTSIAIAGKKLYAGFDGKECVKLASKGVRLSAAEIVRVCQGASIEWANMAPSFSLSGTKFVRRKVTRAEK